MHQALQVRDANTKHDDYSLGSDTNILTVYGKLEGTPILWNLTTVRHSLVS
jgi:hypothetical protein